MDNTPHKIPKESLKTDIISFSAAVLQGTVFVFWAYFLTFLEKPLFIIYWALAALILLGLYLVWKGEFKLTLRTADIPYLVLFGVLGAATFGLLTIGVNRIGASLTSFIMPAGIIFTILMAAVFFKERLSKKEIAGAVIIIVGLFVFNWRADITFTVTSFIILGAAFSQALSHNVAKRLLRSMSGGALNWVRLLSIVLFGIFYLLAVGAELEMLSAQNTLILIAGVILGPIGVFALFYYGVQEGRLSKAIVFKDISPVFTLLFAYLLLGERMTPRQLVAGGIVLIGALMILARRNQATRHRVPAENAP